jgi:hypothetical protein
MSQAAVMFAIDVFAFEEENNGDGQLALEAL